jgi:uncharacterized protein (TIGR03067 family)
MRATLALSTVTFLLFGVAAAQDDAVKKELKKFQGTWEAVSGESAGKPQPPESVEGLTVTFQGDKFVSKKGDKVLQEGTIKIDPAKSPRQIDVIASSGPEADKAQLGIYKFEGDRLIICGTPAGGQRPTAFKTDGDEKAHLIVARRAKARKEQ